MTLYADDPDVHIVYPVSDRDGGDLTFDPVVTVDGYGDVAADWLGDVGSTRDLKVPLYTLPAAVVLTLRLVVPGENDVLLGSLVLRGTASDASTPGANVDHGEVSGTLSVAGGSHEMDLTGDLEITVTGNRDVTLFIHGEGVVTVAGQDFELTGDPDPAVILVVTSPRNVQSAFMAGGGGEPVVEDSTPPSPITDLAAVGGVLTLSGSWSARTDAESDVHYRYRYYLTSAGSGGASWVSTDATSFGPLDVAAGAYTVDAYAYSQGGASATDTATATVDDLVESISITENFTAADGTELVGKTTTTGGQTWLSETTGANAISATGGTIVNNRFEVTSSTKAARLDLGTPLARVRAKFGGGGGNRLVLFCAATSGANTVTAHIIPGVGTKIWSDTNGPELVSVGGAIDEGDIFELTYDGTTATVTRNGVVRATSSDASLAGKTGTSAGIGVMGSGAWLDDVEIESL